MVPTMAINRVCELKYSGHSLTTRKYSAAPAMVRPGRLKRREAMPMMGDVQGGQQRGDLGDLERRTTKLTAVANRQRSQDVLASFKLEFGDDGLGKTEQDRSSSTPSARPTTRVDVNKRMPVKCLSRPPKDTGIVVVGSRHCIQWGPCLGATVMPIRNILGAKLERES